MNSSFSKLRRGAARHWVVGCLVVLTVIIAFIGIGGYFVWKKVSPHLKIETFDVTAKVDPPATAPVDLLLPPTAGTYKRTVVTTETAQIRSSPIPQLPGMADQVTSGLVMGLYGDNEGHGAMVIAVSTEEARKQREARRGPFGTMQGSKQEPNRGFHMRMDFGPQPIDMAVWAKQNWTYMVQTTSTAAMDFAKAFEPSR